MFKWLRGLREETKPIAADAKPHELRNRASGANPPCDVDPIEELVRVVGEAS